MSTVSSPQAFTRPAWGAVYAGVALTAAAAFILQLALARLISVIFYFQFAFLAISIAVLGLAAGGILSCYFSQHGPPLYRRLGVVSAANAVVTTGVLTWLLGQHGADSLGLLGLCAAVFLPFLFSGIVISLVIFESISRVEKLYFWLLSGAAAGCLFIIPLFKIIGAPGVVVASAVLSASASAVWFGVARNVRGRAFGVALALALVGLVTYNKQAHILDLRTAKGAELRDENFVQWNSFSRIALKDGANGRQVITIDADATIPISHFDIGQLTPEESFQLSSEGPAMAYRIRPRAKTLILGAGGGLDVARALGSGSHDVTAVEVNPIIATTIMRRDYAELSHAIFLRPDVRTVVEDGRSFVRHSSAKYQLLQVALMDTWSTNAVGTFALSESNLYTAEAVLEYLNHLTADGVLVFTRSGPQQPQESLRLVAVARQALSHLGAREAWRHVVVIRDQSPGLPGWDVMDSVLICRQPFAPADLAKLHESASVNSKVIYAPDMTGSTVFSHILIAGDVDKFYDRYPVDVRPVSDDRPFYKGQARDARSLQGSTPSENADSKAKPLVNSIVVVLVVSVLAALMTLLLPPLVLGARLQRERGVTLSLPYFLMIGAGYNIIQVCLIQKLSILLGKPTYSLTVLVFSLFLASAFGSFASRRILNHDDRRLRYAPLAVATLVALLASIIAPASAALASAPAFVRVTCVVFMVAPTGFLMGMPLPGGLAMLAQWQPNSLRWAWSITAVASVLGSAISNWSAMYVGLQNTLLLGAGCYVAAAIVLMMTVRFRAQSDSGIFHAF